MFVWRLTLKKHVAPDGNGARRYGGRWNRPGTPIVYASGTLSLAVLEFLVHVDSDILPESLVSVRATIPEPLLIQTIHPSELPGNWKDKIIPVSVQDLGYIVGERCHLSRVKGPLSRDRARMELCSESAPPRLQEDPLGKRGAVLV